MPLPYVLQKTAKTNRTLSFIICVLLLNQVEAQPITGVWKGRIDKKKVELKIIQKGDSLTGTSYYYESANSYRRYTIKGFFDAANNSAVWWDDQLVEDRSGILAGNKGPLLSVADFNCPGGGEMYLNGQTSPKDKVDDKKGGVDLTKVTASTFNDEWNYVISHYTIGANDPYIIDSIALIASTLPKRSREKQTASEPIPTASKKGMVSIPPMPAPAVQRYPVPARPPTIEEKFTSRKKILTKEILLTGDSIEIRFYDNAEIDGDSISLFLNNKLIYHHVRLSDKPFTVKLAVADLLETNELTMVAENLGAIPPNTSFMVAIVEDKRYEAMLASTEKTSASIRLYKHASGR